MTWERKSSDFRDLEDRTTAFAIQVIKLCKTLPRDAIHRPLIEQIIRSSGSVGANYREANEALGKKDFCYRVRIARKETKETEHWLTLLEEASQNPLFESLAIRQEAMELRKIFTAIITKSS